MQLGVRSDSAGLESAEVQTYKTATDISAGQQRRGRPFQPGQSGNPRGRPAGSRNHITLMLDRLAEADAIDVLRAIVAKAKEGDPRAAELLFSRIWPPRRSRPVILDLPSLATATDLSAALGRVAQAAANGWLAPDEAQAIGAVLELQRKAIETADLEARVARLEDKTP
jgi:hypothetical protein